MTIWLVRHGQAAAGMEELDPGLTETGHRQAAAAAAALTGAPAVRLVVSPLRRTRETAAPIAAALGLAPEIRHEVAEVFDPEVTVEERQANIGPLMAGTWSDQTAHLQLWRQRVVDTLVGLAREATAAGGELVVVSHYVAIGAAIGAATGNDHVVPVHMANAAITRLALEHERLSLIEAASIAHLPAELVTGVDTAFLGTGLR